MTRLLSAASRLSVTEDASEPDFFQGATSAKAHPPTQILSQPITPASIPPALSSGLPCDALRLYAECRLDLDEFDRMTAGLRTRMVSLHADTPGD